MLAIAVVVASLGLLFAEAWSISAFRRSAGQVSHRFAIDRLLLTVFALVAITGGVGVGLGLNSRGPADPLHLLYGPLALVSLPIGYVLSRTDAGGRWGRTARSWALPMATIALLGLEYRLFSTG